ncbi:Bax protein [Marinobacter daqiaonensis]|uniref:Bax protein n=1 Tax=Marinobacter daqiaonensis TaxID=650891 RepID=A0A1I6HB09_9GAMM|nr:glucosaminidase domain-containing protein [Marinobacter daqiaonensis]SFR51675.1 Bax protein [Marinobacter daqiaonensis]
MSAGLRSTLLIAPLVAIILWGALYTPPPYTVSTEDDDIELASLPDLPDWINERLPNFDHYTDVTEKKEAFFAYLYSRTLLANSRILLQRQHLKNLQASDTLTEEDQQWLARQAERLRVDEDNGTEEMFELLLKRLDTIPPSLVLAQAANESAWGTSRFAQQGNNLFGQWCFSPGCGLIPLGRPEGASYEVASFRSAYHSVRAYIQNLNRHPAYQSLRDLRQQLRNKGQHPTGVQLAAGLGSYSERGDEYIRELREMIRYNNLPWYDQRYRETIVSRDNLEGLMELATAPEKRLQPDYDPDPETAE